MKRASRTRSTPPSVHVVQEGKKGEPAAVSVVITGATLEVIVLVCLIASIAGVVLAQR